MYPMHYFSIWWETIESLAVLLFGTALQNNIQLLYYRIDSSVGIAQNKT